MSMFMFLLMQQDHEYKHEYLPEFVRVPALEHGRKQEYEYEQEHTLTHEREYNMSVSMNMNMNRT